NPCRRCRRSHAADAEPAAARSGARLARPCGHAGGGGCGTLAGAPVCAVEGTEGPIVSLDQKLERVIARHEQLGADLASDQKRDPQDFARMSKEYAELAPLVEAIGTLRDVRREIADLETLRDDAATDGEMRALAESELPALEERATKLDREIRVLLLPKDEADERNAILEIRAGTGGDEAALFGGVLLSMYSRYAELRGWKFEIMSASETSLGGFKEAVASITGRGVFARLKFESGVHRV